MQICRWRYLFSTREQIWMFFTIQYWMLYTTWWENCERLCWSQFAYMILWIACSKLQATSRHTYGCRKDFKVLNRLGITLIWFGWAWVCSVQLVEIVPSALVLYILRKMPPKRMGGQYHPIRWRKQLLA
jgi:hypothetical protein